MKISVNIVRQLAGTELPPINAVIERINAQLGVIEDIIDLGAKYKDAKVVRVVECVKHPDADKLSVCRVDAGSGDLVQVVCGAPNVHADMWAVWLPPGSTVPSTFDDAEPFVLGARELRGVLSQGMLAAGDELAINADHAGIIEITERDLPAGRSLQAGASFAELFGLDDTIIDIENKMFTHRPDCFGQLGVAREISAIVRGAQQSENDAQETKFANPSWYQDLPVFTATDGLELQVNNTIPDKTPRFMAVAMKDVQVGPSPLWLQCVLVALGAKPINNVVDLTNYIMLLTAQPTHAYDYDTLRGHILETRMAKDGETALLLNGKTYSLHSDDIVIADGEGVVGLAGIMGGRDSEVSADTRNIVLEVATFDMYAVRKSSMRHGVFTDALTRFNKGQSPLQNSRVLAELMRLIEEVTGGTQAGKVHDESSTDWTTTESLSGEIRISVDFINARLGSSLAALEISGLLRRVNFSVHSPEGDDRALLITAPFWRTDIGLPEDIVEEVGRLYGLDRLPRVLPTRSIAPAPRNPYFQMRRKIGQILSGAGANEVKTYSFVHERVLRAAGQDPSQAFRIANALSPDLQFYRLSLLPSLLDKIHANIKSGHDEFALYEFGKAHRSGDLDDDGLPRQYPRLAFVYAAKKSVSTPYYTARRYLELLDPQLRCAPLDTFDVEKYPIFAQLAAPFESKRAAVVLRGDKIAGIIGEFTRSTQRALKLPGATAGFEIFQSQLLSITPAPYVPLSRFPYVTQDISLRVVDQSVTYESMYTTALNALKPFQDPNLSLGLTLLGIYRPDDGASRTYTFRLKATSYTHTLTDDMVSSYLAAIAVACHETLQAEQV